MALNSPLFCPLCLHADSSSQQFSILAHERWPGRKYWKCPACDLIWAEKPDHPTREAERHRYSQHRNSVESQGYREFLSRLMVPVLEILDNPLPANFRALDFGSGPEPALKMLFKEHGIKIETHDPIFPCDVQNPVGPYDLICCSEVVEHFRDPRKNWDFLLSLLGPTAILAVMTQFHDEVDFNKWWYVKDPTHLAFYSTKTLRWISRHFGIQIVRLSGSIFIAKRTQSL